MLKRCFYPIIFNCDCPHWICVLLTCLRKVLLGHLRSDFAIIGLYLVSDAVQCAIDFSVIFGKPEVHPKIFHC